MFMPVPPKISLPMITPKVVATASCHQGMVGGTISAIRKPDTRNPSLTSWRRITANRNSQPSPTA